MLWAGGPWTVIAVGWRVCLSLCLRTVAHFGLAACCLLVWLLDGIGCGNVLLGELRGWGWWLAVEDGAIRPALLRLGMGIVARVGPATGLGMGTIGDGDYCAGGAGDWPARVLAGREGPGSSLAAVTERMVWLLGRGVAAWSESGRWTYNRLV